MKNKMKITRRQLKRIIKEELDRLHEDEMSADEIRARSKEISDAADAVARELGIAQDWAIDKALERALSNLRHRSMVINTIMTGELKDIFMPRLWQVRIDNIRTKGLVASIRDEMLQLSPGTKAILKVSTIYQIISDMIASGSLDSIWEQSGGGVAAVRAIVEEVERRASH